MSTSPRRYARVMRAVTEQPWAILPDRLEALIDVLEVHLDGGPLSEEDITARVGSPPPVPVTKLIETVVVIPVLGVLAHRMNLMTAMSGGMSTQMLGQAVRAAVADPAVTAVLLDVDSPGGNVFGLQEAADVIYTARGTKPIIAVANALAASGAYWIASQADQFLMTPSGQVGSIGVIATHVDRSKQAEMLGLKHTIVTAGRFKGSEANDLVPMDDPTREALQRKVDQYYDAFVRAVARGRGVAQRDVREGFGEGRMLTARDAVTARMVDVIATIDEALDALLGGKRRVPLPGSRAMAAVTSQDPVEPDEDGNCPDGHEKRDDGMCHLVEGKASAAALDEVSAFRRQLEALGA